MSDVIKFPETESQEETKEVPPTMEELKEKLEGIDIDILSLSDEVVGFLAEHAGIIGGSAVIGLLLKKQDLSDLKGLKALCALAGIAGLAGAAGAVSGGHLKKKVHYFFGVAKDIRNGIFKKKNPEPTTE